MVCLISNSTFDVKKPGLPSVVTAIGDERFGSELLAYLNQACRAEHVAIFQFAQGAPIEIASVSLDGTDSAHRQVSLYVDGQYWRVDPSMIEAQRCIERRERGLIRLDVDSLPSSVLRDRIYRSMHIRERVLICGGSTDAHFGLSILRSDRHGIFSEHEIEGLSNVAEMLLSILEKHCGICWQHDHLSMALTSLEEIERCISQAEESFPKREAQVCARILYGLSSVGIALDLGIGDETVMTYRKRAYQRLSIGSQRELLLWYISLWGKSSCKGGRRSRLPSTAPNVGRLRPEIRNTFLES
jgi:DNA-binding NarL/FixJ family response regulator